MKLYKLIFVSSLIVITHCADEKKLPNGCKCEQIQLKANCEHQGLYCKWSGSKCSVKPCAERDDKNCELGLMFGHKDEMNCFKDPISNLCVEKTDPDCPAIALPADDGSGNVLTDDQLRGICKVYRCDFDVTTQKCVVPATDCDYSTLAECASHLYGSNGVAEGYCLWNKDKCHKQVNPRGCDDYISTSNCPLQCKWDTKEQKCRFNRCDELSGTFCKLLSEITDNGTAKVCQIEGDGCSGKNPNTLTKDTCLSRLFNFYRFNTETEICEICDEDFQNIEDDSAGYWLSLNLLFFGIFVSGFI